MNNEEYIKQLADMEKQNKQVELAQAKASALTALEQEKAKVLPTFTAQKQQASVQSQLGAKNLAEFWANRGQTNAGISAQAEMSRQNALGGVLGNIGQQEQQAVTDYSNTALGYETQYNNDLNNAYGTIGTNLSTNLYNERLRQQQIAEAERIRLANIKAEQAAIRLRAYFANKETKQAEQPNGAIRVMNSVAEEYKDGKWTPVKYAEKLNGKKVNQKTYDWNKKGYALTNNDAPVTYKKSGGGKGTYKQWYKDGNYYIIDNDQPILISGTEEQIYDSVNKAYTSGKISKTRANEIMYGIFPTDNLNATAKAVLTTNPLLK